MRLIQDTDGHNTLPTLFGLSFVVLGWFLLSLTLSGLFITPLVFSGSAVLIAMSALIAVRVIRRATWIFRAACIAALLFALLPVFFSEPTIFSGRDQGSIAEAAWRLSENGQLAFSLPAAKIFADIYDTEAPVDMANNFPGFAYVGEDALITAFPLGYTSWLAGFVSIFGLHGYAIGNGLLLFLSLITLYSLIRLFASSFYAFAGLILAGASFLPSWFAKMTLTENLALFLFLFLAESLILYLRSGKFVFYAATLLAGGLFAFTRLEGFAFLAIALALMLFSVHTRAIWKTYPMKSVIIPGIVFALFFLRDFFLNLPYYRMAGKGLLGFSGSIGESAASGPAAISGILFIYGLFMLFLIGLSGILVFIKKYRFEFLLPALIALPTFIYLFSPNITPDHPWMLRRYLFSVFPVLLFSAVLGIALLFDKTGEHPIPAPRGKRLFFVGIIFTSLLFLELPAFLYALPYAEHRGLATEVASLGERFTDRDLILVDRFTTGDNFAMLSGPMQFLHRKNTVYFFNTEDLDRLDTSGFDRVFLLIPEDGMERYAAAFGDRLVLEERLSLPLSRFESLSLRNSPPRLPAKIDTRVSDLLFRVY
jgi:hypothetical protein